MSSQDLVETLCRAIRANDWESVYSILTENPQIVRVDTDDLSTQKRRSPMWEVMLAGDEDMVKLLIGFGGNVNEPCLYNIHSEWFGLSFLQSLAFVGEFWNIYRKVASTLIRHSRHELKDSMLVSALQWALEEKNLLYAQFLLENGAKLEGPGWDTDSPIIYLFKAPKNIQREMLQLLIKYGMKTKVCNERDQDYIVLTIRKADSEKDNIDVVGIVEVLMETGISVRTAHFFEAIYLENMDLLNLFIKKGYDVNSKKGGVSALHVAARRNNKDILRLLLSKGANINAKKEGNTPLHHACWKRCEVSIKFLLQNGAQINEINDNNDTAFELLEPQEHKDSDVQCIKIMVKEIARAKFFNDSMVHIQDIQVIEAHKVLKELFQIFTEELSQMKKTKFYAHHNFCSIWKMSKKNPSKFAKLADNIEFVEYFKKYLDQYPNYKSDLLQVLMEAQESKMESLIVNFILKHIFGDILPDNVLSVLAEHLSPKDLPGAHN